MGLNETLDRLAKEREQREQGITEIAETPEKALHAIPRLDEWELNLTMAALRQYIKLNLQPFREDTLRQKKRKRFNHMKVSSAIGKIRDAQRNCIDETTT